MNKYLPGVFVVVLAVGCKPEAIPVSKPLTEANAPTTMATTPTTEAECREFAESLQRAARATDQARLDELLDLGAMARRALEPFALPEAERMGVLKVLESANANGSPLTRSILSGINAGGSYRLLHVRLVDGRPRATFRLYRADEGLNYHEIVTARRADGRVIADEIYLFLSGESMTETIRRIVLPSVAELNRKAIDSVKGDDAIYMSQMQAINAFSAAVGSGKRAEAKQLYNVLAPKSRTLKSVALLRVKMHAGAATPGDYRNAILDLQRSFPNDPLTDYLSIDYHVLAREFDQARACVDRVDGAIGGDPAMRSMKGNVYLAEGKYAEAITIFEKAIREDPSYRDAYWARITVALKQKNHADVLSWLKTLVEQTSESVGDLSKISGFNDFVASAEHPKWLQWYSARRK